LKKRVTLQTTTQQQSRLFERLQNKPFWMWVAVENHWKLKAIDSVEASSHLPAEERKKLIDNLLDNQEIKDLLVPDKHNDNNNVRDI
jgi:hypothetical protein